MKNILLFFIIITTCSCSNFLNKPIFEQLTLEELDKAVRKDSLFANSYECIQKINNKILKSDADKAKYNNLTYGRVHKTWVLLNVTLFYKYLDEWKGTYKYYLPKIDSVSNYWRNFNNGNVPESIIEYWNKDGKEYSVISEEIIKEYIDENYINSFEYISNHAIDSLKKVDSLSCEYLLQK